MANELEVTFDDEGILNEKDLRRFTDNYVIHTEGRHAVNLTYIAHATADYKDVVQISPVSGRITHLIPTEDAKGKFLAVDFNKGDVSVVIDRRRYIIYSSPLSPEESKNQHCPQGGAVRGMD